MPLTPSEKKLLLDKVGWDCQITDYINSMDEAQIYILAGLRQATIGSHPALIRNDIRWWACNCQTEQPNERWAAYSNADLIREGQPPRDDDGNPYGLFHIGQHLDSPLAELSQTEFMSIQNTSSNQCVIADNTNNEESSHWQERYRMFNPEELNIIHQYRK